MWPRWSWWAAYERCTGSWVCDNRAKDKPGGRQGASAMTYSSDEALPIGTVVHERYRTLAIVGRGGVGTVYQVADVLYGKNNTYALKELASQTAAARRQFDNEAQWLQALDHNNIPKVREYFEWA